MKTHIRKLFILIVFSNLFLYSCTPKVDDQTTETSFEKFSFVFMTDIHLQANHNYANLPLEYDYSPLRAFSMAIDTANQFGADFVLMGGDNVFDVMRGQAHADTLFELYTDAKKKFAMPVYDVIGNHDLFGIYPGSNISTDNPDYKYGMFERYLGESNYSYDHKGWHFIVLNSLDAEDGRYIRTVHEKQMEWLEDLVDSLDREKPIVLSLHIPLVSVRNQIYPNDRDNPEPYPSLNNRNELLDLFKNHNLKLVLQGHVHWVEEVYVQDMGTRFITGGAIAGRPSWRGFRHGPPGFIHISINEDDSFTWDFIDYGWMEVIGKPAGWESTRR
jgi:predicted MPP superfamily phosphohydrolase